MRIEIGVFFHQAFQSGAGQRNEMRHTACDKFLCHFARNAAHQKQAIQFALAHQIGGVFRRVKIRADRFLRDTIGGKDGTRRNRSPGSFRRQGNALTAQIRNAADP